MGLYKSTTLKMECREDLNPFGLSVYHLLTENKSSVRSISRFDGIRQYGQALAWCRRYRIVSGKQYVKHFASDRSHMLCKDGSWQAEPPIYPCIISSGSYTHHYVEKYCSGRENRQM